MYWRPLRCAGTRIVKDARNLVFQTAAQAFTAAGRRGGRSARGQGEALKLADARDEVRKLNGLTMKNSAPSSSANFCGFIVAMAETMMSCGAFSGPSTALFPARHGRRALA